MPSRFTLALQLAGLLLAAATGAAAPGTALAHQSPGLIQQRAVDSVRVEVLRKLPDLLLAQKQFPAPISRAQQTQMLRAGQALASWTTTYIKPLIANKAVAQRHFGHLILAGRYYTWANRYDLALGVYAQADRLFPKGDRESEAARSLVSNYDQELMNGVRRINKSGYQTRTEATYSFAIQMIEAGFDSAKYADNMRRLRVASSQEERRKIQQKIRAEDQAAARQQARQDSIGRSHGLMQHTEELQHTDAQRDKL